MTETTTIIDSYEIKLIRFLRDCGSNKSAEMTGKGARIFDFEVHVNGEHRADLRRIFRGQGYELCAPLRYGGRMLSDSKRYFFDFKIKALGIADWTICDLIRRGLIPQVCEYEEQQKRSIAAAKIAHAESRRAARAARIYQAGPKLLKYLSGCLREDGLRPGDERKARALIESLRKLPEVE